MSSDDVGRGRYEDLAAAYALGALDDEERREFEGYLTQHPELQAEVEELDEASCLWWGEISPQLKPLFRLVVARRWPHQGKEFG